MPRVFSIRPSLTFKGRKFKGLRGFAGKPFHPPLTDIPVAAYVFAAAFDLISFLTRYKGPITSEQLGAAAESSVSHDFFVSATHVIIAGLIVSVPTALTGFWDWLKSTPKHTQARRTANWHMAVMFTVTAIVIVDVILRLSGWENGETRPVVLILSVLAGGLVSFGSLYGGSLIYDYGFNVETSGDHPVWHESEKDVLPGEDHVIDD
jgi:uncharacterized membrane protein